MSAEAWGTGRALDWLKADLSLLDDAARTSAERDSDGGKRDHLRVSVSLRKQKRKEKNRKVKERETGLFTYSEGTLVGCRWRPSGWFSLLLSLTVPPCVPPCPWLVWRRHIPAELPCPCWAEQSGLSLGTGEEENGFNSRRSCLWPFNSLLLCKAYWEEQGMLGHHWNVRSHCDKCHRHLIHQAPFLILG